MAAKISQKPLLQLTLLFQEMFIMSWRVQLTTIKDAFPFSSIDLGLNFQNIRTVGKMGPNFWRNVYPTKLEVDCILNGPISVHTQNGGQSINGFWKIYAASHGQNIHQLSDRWIKKRPNFKKCIFFLSVFHFHPNRPLRTSKSALFQKKHFKGAVPP